MTPALTDVACDHDHHRDDPNNLAQNPVHLLKSLGFLSQSLPEIS